MSIKLKTIRAPWCFEKKARKKFAIQLQMHYGYCISKHLMKISFVLENFTSQYGKFKKGKKSNKEVLNGLRDEAVDFFPNHL